MMFEAVSKFSVEYEAAFFMEVLNDKKEKTDSNVVYPSVAT